MASSTAPSGRWIEQWERTKRWFSRFSAINAGRPHDSDSDNYHDEVYAFFQSCYHLKDWLKNDSSSGGVASDVETFINGSSDLCICGAICNGSKHSSLTTYSRASHDTQIQQRHVNLNLTSNVLGPNNVETTTTISVKYIIVSGGTNYDAFAIAEACMEEWESYLKGKRLI